MTEKLEIETAPDGRFMLAFIDFEVFRRNWLAVVAAPDEGMLYTVADDREELLKLRLGLDAQARKAGKELLWAGYNIRGYDCYIYKALALGLDPYSVSEYIISQGKAGWSYTKAFREVSFPFYEVMSAGDKGLKYLEACSGKDIKESSVPFTIRRELTSGEIGLTARYCRRDVLATTEVFSARRAAFDARRTLVAMYKLKADSMGLTDAQLAAALMAGRPSERQTAECMSMDATPLVPPYADEGGQGVARHSGVERVREFFMGETVSTLKGKGFGMELAGLRHDYGSGGVHAARTGFSHKGLVVSLDVASLYPSLMTGYGLESRLAIEGKLAEILSTRLEMKRKHDPRQAALKLVINTAYGATNGGNKQLTDYRNGLSVCTFGQVMITDLIESLEEACGLLLIQTNTDGVFFAPPEGTPPEREETWLEGVREAYRGWEERTGLSLEEERFTGIWQKDVNNYLAARADGSVKAKGAYAVKDSSTDREHPAIARAVQALLMRGTPVEESISGEDSLMRFMLPVRITSKFECIMHGGVRVPGRVARCFASCDESDCGLTKVAAKDGKPYKIGGLPEHLRILNGDVTEARCPAWLDRDWYAKEALKLAKAAGWTPQEEGGGL